MPDPDEDVLWAAGLFEGEGWISGTYTKGRWYPRVGVQMCDEDVVRHFHGIIGAGRVNGPYRARGKPHYKPQWQWQATGQEARRVIHRLLPYLGSRRQLRAMEVMTHP
jgi:hypothetical protein